MGGQSIGIFDSGVGGLTVLRQIATRLPQEPLVYLGDTARVPYGTKSADTVIRYARQCAGILLDRGIKFLVVACNTASAYAIDVLREEMEIPVLGVVEPGAAAAVAASENQRIGVIGTAGTISSGIYPARIKSLLPDAQVFTQACPLFVPLAEEGWLSGEVPYMAAQHYLGEMMQQGIDTLVLGCTHYPLLKETICRVAGQKVKLIDSAEATARVIEEVIEGLGIAADGSHRAAREFLVSDAPENFARIGRRFLGYEIEQVEWVDF